MIFKPTNLKKNLLLPLLFAVTFSASAQLQWERIFPQPTENLITDLVFLNPLEGVFCTSFETFTTSNGGETWDGVEFGGSYVLEAHEQAIASLTTTGRLFISYDGGNNWELRFDGSANEIDLREVSFTNANEITLLGRDSDFIKRLYRSTDAGLSWDTLDVSLPSGARQLSVIDGDTLFVAWSGSIYKSENSGSSLSLSYESPNSGTEITVLQVMNDTTIYGIGSKGAFFKTVDRGETWETTTIIEVSGSEFLSQMHFSDPMNGYASMSSGRFFRTNDGGNTWIELLTFDAFNYSDLTSIFALSAELLYGGGEGGILFKTTDAFESFTANTIPLDRAEAIELADENTAYLKGREVLYRFDLVTEEYIEVEPYWEGSDSKNSFHFFDDQTGMGLSEDGLFRKTTDGAISWTEIEVDDAPEGEFMAFEFVDEENGIILEETSTLWKTTNAGLDWVVIFEGDVEVFDAVSTNLFFLVNRAESGQMSLLRSTDGGENWAELVDLYGFFYSEIYFLDESTGFAVSNFGTRRTDDAGESWQLVSSGISDIRFVDDGVGLALNSQEVYFTNDGGVNWSPAGPATGANSYATDGSRIVTLNDLYAIHTAPINTLSTKVASESNNSLIVYPNPASDELTVVIPDGRWSTYEVIDINGKMLSRGTIQNQELLMIDFREIAAGFYLIRLSGEEAVMEAKVIKQ